MKKTSVGVDAISSPPLVASPREAAEAVVFMPGKPGSIADWTQPVANVDELARAVTMDALRPLNLLPYVIWDANDPYISVEFAARQCEVSPARSCRIALRGKHRSQRPGVDSDCRQIKRTQRDLSLFLITTSGRGPRSSLSGRPGASHAVTRFRFLLTFSSIQLSRLENGPVAVSRRSK